MELLEESGQSVSSPDLEDNYKKEDLKQEARAMHRNAHVHHLRTLFFFTFTSFYVPTKFHASCASCRCASRGIVLGFAELVQRKEKNLGRRPSPSITGPGGYAPRLLAERAGPDGAGPRGISAKAA